MPLKLIPPRPGKTPFWSVRGTHCGVYLDRSTKFVSQAKAGGQLRIWRDEIERGRLSRPGELTFLDAAVAYRKAGGDDRFLGSYDETTGEWSGILAELGALALAAVDQAEIDRVALKLLPKASAATRNRQVYTPVSAVLKAAGRKFAIQRPKGWRGGRRTEWLTTAEAFRLLDGAAGVDAEFGIFLEFLLYTGARLSEATAIRCARVDLKEAWAWTPKTKNDDPRMIFLPPSVVAALANHPRGLDRDATVFRFRKNGRLYALLKAATKAAGVTLPPRSAFHILRHTWATWMRRYGGLDTTGLLATRAWRDAASVRRYEHVALAEEARKASALPVRPQTASRGKSVEKRRRSA